MKRILLWKYFCAKHNNFGTPKAIKKNVWSISHKMTLIMVVVGPRAKGQKKWRQVPRKTGLRIVKTNMMIGYKHFDFCTKVFLYERKRVYIFKQATYLFLFEYSLLVVWIQYILFFIILVKWCGLSLMRSKLTCSITYSWSQEIGKLILQFECGAQVSSHFHFVVFVYSLSIAQIWVIEMDRRTTLKWILFEVLKCN